MTNRTNNILFALLCALIPLLILLMYWDDNRRFEKAQMEVVRSSLESYERGETPALDTYRKATISRMQQRLLGSVIESMRQGHRDSVELELQRAGATKVVFNMEGE